MPVDAGSSSDTRISTTTALDTRSHRHYTPLHRRTRHSTPFRYLFSHATPSETLPRAFVDSHTQHLFIPDPRFCEHLKPNLSPQSTRENRGTTSNRDDRENETPGLAICRERRKARTESGNARTDASARGKRAENSSNPNQTTRLASKTDWCMIPPSRRKAEKQLAKCSHI